MFCSSNGMQLKWPPWPQNDGRMVTLVPILFWKVVDSARSSEAPSCTCSSTCLVARLVEGVLVMAIAVFLLTSVGKHT
jgi:hypothetical protein